MEEKHGHGHGIIRGTIPDQSNSYATWKLKACALCYIKQILADLGPPGPGRARGKEKT